MANPTWEMASVDEKLEMLRKDVGDVSDAHNWLGREHVQLVGQVNKLEKELADLRSKTAGE